MAFDGSGTFNRIYDWTDDAGNGINITASRFDTEMDGMATGLSTCITKDGQTTITANLPMATYRHTGVGNGAARDDYLAVGQMQDDAVVWCGTAGGTGDVITLNTSPVTTAHTAGQRFVFIASAANTGATTVNPNTVGAKNVTKFGATALAANDILAAMVGVVEYDGTQYQLLNPATAANWAQEHNNNGTHGTIVSLVATTADINGGTWQGTIDGSWTASGQTCADLGTVTTADINGEHGRAQLMGRGQHLDRHVQT
jgi:hypothetical protein